MIDSVVDRAWLAANKVKPVVVYRSPHAPDNIVYSMDCLISVIYFGVAIPKIWFKYSCTKKTILSATSLFFHITCLYLLFSSIILFGVISIFKSLPKNSLNNNKWIDICFSAIPTSFKKWYYSLLKSIHDQMDDRSILVDKWFSFWLNRINPIFRAKTFPVLWLVE